MASKKKVTGGKRPQNLRRTLGQFSAYLGRHRIMIGLVALLAAISALAALFGTYMIRPVVNGLLENGSKAYLAGAVGLTACIYIIGALSTLGYTQLMVRAAQKVLQEIRQDLFAHLQTQPLQYFDTHRNGDLMSLFTNDVDTEQQLCCRYPDLYPGRGHPADAVYPQLAALSAGGGGLCGHVLVHQLFHPA